jgi:hypothetical protein
MMLTMGWARETARATTVISSPVRSHWKMNTERTQGGLAMKPGLMRPDHVILLPDKGLRPCPATSSHF